MKKRVDNQVTKHVFIELALLTLILFIGGLLVYIALLNGII